MKKNFTHEYEQRNGGQGKTGQAAEYTQNHLPQARLSPQKDHGTHDIDNKKGKCDRNSGRQKQQ